jgi:hypothetical protein
MHKPCLGLINPSVHGDERRYDPNSVSAPIRWGFRCPLRGNGPLSSRNRINDVGYLSSKLCLSKTLQIHDVNLWFVKDNELRQRGRKSDSWSIVAEKPKGTRKKWSRIAPYENDMIKETRYDLNQDDGHDFESQYHSTHISHYDSKRYLYPVQPSQ